MPEICRFYGIIIAMFYSDHNPPHFHARYGEHKVVVKIDDFAVMEGHLPPKALGLVMEWATQHQDELLQDWKAAGDNRPLLAIEALK